MHQACQSINQSNVFTESKNLENIQLDILSTIRLTYSRYAVEAWTKIMLTIALISWTDVEE